MPGGSDSLKAIMLSSRAEPGSGGSGSRNGSGGSSGGSSGSSGNFSNGVPATPTKKVYNTYLEQTQLHFTHQQAPVPTPQYRGDNLPSTLQFVLVPGAGGVNF